MKVRYFTVLAVISLLSFSTIAGCKNSETAQTSSSTATEVKTNPCAAKANPSAAKIQSVGAPLAAELQGKPVVVDIFATWCSGCQNIAPTLTQLKQKYGDRVNFVVLDVTDRDKLQVTQATAEKLGLGQFLEASKSDTSSVAIIDPATGKILAMFNNNPDREDYTKVLDSALAKS
jgi:thiol-disulfide isomerase/thioredoxin